MLEVITLGKKHLSLKKKFVNIIFWEKFKIFSTNCILIDKFEAIPQLQGWSTYSQPIWTIKNNIGPWRGFPHHATIGVTFCSINQCRVNQCMWESMINSICMESPIIHVLKLLVSDLPRYDATAQNFLGKTYTYFNDKLGKWL